MHVSSEEIFYGYLPAIAAIFTIPFSVRLASRIARASQWFVTALVCAANGYALLLLKRMLVDGAWPVTIPHALIICSIVVVTLQFGVERRMRQNQSLDTNALSRQ